ncbi:MAG TPA: response regulator transcription factor [Gemmatimonadaceae bacterium]
MAALLWLVEDNALYRETVSDLLVESGRFRGVRAFADAESALALVDQRVEIPELVLMDIALPGMSGSECVRALRKRLPGVPVVMLTVHQSNDRIFEAVCAGASGYLLKSAAGAEILDAVERVLDGGAAMDAQIARRVLEMFARFGGPPADYGLSDRERQILQLLVDGFTKQHIANQLELSPHTIDGHVRNIYMKLHVNNRSGAVAKALRERLL